MSNVLKIIHLSYSNIFALVLQMMHGKRLKHQYYCPRRYF